MKEEDYVSYALPERDQRNWKDYLCFAPRSFRVYFARLSAVMTWRFMIFLIVSQGSLKGIAYTISNGILFPIFKNVLSLDAATLQIYLLLIFIPWSLKPIFGLLSDFVIVGGYHRRYWLYQGLGAGCVCGGFLFLAYTTRSAVGIALCLMGIQFEISIFDLMSEATFSITKRDHPYTGSDIPTYVQGLQDVGAIVALIFIGTLADAGLYYVAFGIMMFFILTPAAPTVAGWLPEIKKDTQNKCIALASGINENKWIIAVITFAGLAAPISSIVANTTSPMMGLSIALLMTIAAVVGAFFVFPGMVPRLALFQMLTSLARPALGSAMDYFYTADPECLPGGPYFSMSYYITVAGILGMLASLLGIFIYQNTLGGLRYRTVLIITAVLSGLIGASDLFIITRTNIEMGIPDKWAYVVGEAIMEPLLNKLNYIPTNTLLMSVMPKGMESSCYAFLAGISNFSSMVSELSGAIIFETAGVKTTVPCDFSALPWLILVCHVAMPTLVGIGSAFLIPNVKQTDKLDENGNVIAKNTNPLLETTDDDE
jgi:hypothetical protein